MNLMAAVASQGPRFSTNKNQTVIDESLRENRENTIPTGAKRNASQQRWTTIEKQESGMANVLLTETAKKFRHRKERDLRSVERNSGGEGAVAVWH